MPRERPIVQALTGDGLILSAILDVLCDLRDLMDARLLHGEGPVRVSEPAPAGRPSGSVPVSEPAPDEPLDKDADPLAEGNLPEPPARAGRGSSQTAWLAWARTAGAAVNSGMTRDQIIDACITAGVLSDQ